MPLLLLLAAAPAFAQEQAIQRALIERDQRTVEFAARLRGAPLAEMQRLENVAARQRLEVAKELPDELRPYEREKAAAEHVLRLPPPVARAPSEAGTLKPLAAEVSGIVNVIPAVSLQNLTNGRASR